MMADGEEADQLGAKGIRMYGERAELERADADRFWNRLSDEDRERVWKHGVAICIPDANDSMRSSVARLANDWADSHGLGLADIEEDRAIESTINRATHARKVQANQEAQIAELDRERDFYRDSLRRILGVTRTDGEALIALIEVRLRDADVQAADVCTDIEELLDIKRTDQDEPLRERLVRVGLVVVEMLDARRRASNRSKRWQARARKAEDRVAVLEKMAEDLTIERDALTEERNGLTLQPWEAAKQIAKRKGGRK